MHKVYSLKDIENKGYRVGSIRESELEKALRNNIKSSSGLANEYMDLQDEYSKRVKDFDQERKKWNQDALRYGASKRHDDIIEPPKIDTEINSKVSESRSENANTSEINDKDIISHSQIQDIAIGGAEELG
ncbi:6170_t:CDS:2, partial [Acaulospora morrowiae]